jgi:hypothetical protein
MKSAKSGLKVRAGVKAGGMSRQHNRRVLKVLTGVRVGGIATQHNRRVLKLRNARG